MHFLTFVASLTLASVIAGCSSNAGERSSPDRTETQATVKTEFSTFSDSQLREACRTGLRVDLDGDGDDDRVAHTYVGRGRRAEAVLSACLSNGQVSALDGFGQTEGPLEAVDSNRDGRAEIIYGGTTVCAVVGAVAVVEDGRLTEVELPNGDQLVVSEGCGERQNADGWGCQGLDLVLVTANPEVDRRSNWTRERVRIADRTARVVRRESGTSTASRSYAYALPADLIPEPCPTLGSA